ncbi:MAG: hypothetical protein KatS3mg029_0152 [Saprospiraceae bacterium]|nr:MAG: hypothetical protein KatS3mg029_0152 [Saprospiraceae bacterium]
MTRPFSPSTIASNIGAWVALVVLTMFASPFVLHAQQENCCQGGAKIRSLVLQYTGDDCTATHHNQDPSKVFCDGNPANTSPVKIIVNNKSNPDDGNKWFEGTVNLGENFTVAAANGGKSELSADTWVHIYDNQHNLLQRIRFHTSCSQPIAAGNQFGSILVVQITLTNDTQCGIAPPPCQPCDDGGKIEGDEFSCGPFDPAKITESEAPACNLTPPPPPVDCCADGNKIAKITMTYTGQDCSATSHSQDPSKVSCSGDPAGATTVVIIASEKQGGTGKIWFSGQVNLHESFVIDAANAGEDRLKAETWVDVKSTSGQLLQRIRFHTSCSQPLATGDQFGSLQVKSIVLEDGSTCGETPPADTNPDCCDLGGKPKAITMTYTGQDCSATSHSQDPSKVTCSGDPANAASVVIIASEKQGGTGKIWFSGQVNLHESFVIDAANAGEDRLKAETWVDVKSTSGQLLQRIRFHTSCSQPLATGDQFGSLQVKSIVLEDGSTCGETPPADTNPDCCDLGGKPKAITMTYTGQDCSATSHSQDPSKVTCSGDPANAASVVIIASEKQGGAGKIWFSGQVNLHESFVIDAANAGEDRLKAETWVDVKSTSGQLLQRIRFHTSCSQPLATGDQFGSLRVEQVLLDNGQTCSPPSPPPAPELEYQWLMAFNGCPTNLSQAIPGATEAEYDPPYTKVTTWFVRLARPKDCSGDDDAWVASNCVVKRVVNVEINFSDVSCHDNDTFDPADDTWRFMLIVTGSGSGWTATGSNGAGVFQLDGSYGVPVQLGPFKISDGPITLEAKDKDHPQCKTSATLMPPATLFIATP